MDLLSRSFTIGLLGVLIMGTLWGCAAPVESTSPAESEGEIRGVVLPHHLLVEDYMEDFYTEVAERVDGDSIESIILISPNHFGYGFHAIQTTDAWSTEDGRPGLDLETIEFLAENSPVAIEPLQFEKEHGITVHFPFLQDHFPNANVIPLTVKNKIPETMLEQFLSVFDDVGFENTLVIASIDFTHYVAEEVAVRNDERTVEWLENLPQTIQLEEIVELAVSLDADKNSESVAMDSPETLYLLLKLISGQSYI